MCYDIKASLASQLRRAQLKSDESAIKELLEKIKPFVEDNLYHASGYAHPQTIIYTNKEPFLPTVSIWGLIPYWIKDNKQRYQFWHNTLNARGETIFDKPSFKESAKHKRCIVILDGFYEHHHYKGSIYPFLIQKKSKQPMNIAGLWSEWLDKETGEIINSFSIVTTRANKLMDKIHNNPKLSESRMPVILKEEVVEQWLLPMHNDTDIRTLKELIQPYAEDDLIAHTVQKLRGKNALGNIVEACKEHVYEEFLLDLN